MSYESPEIESFDSGMTDDIFKSAVERWVLEEIWDSKRDDEGNRTFAGDDSHLLWWKLEQKEEYWSSWTFDGYSVQVRCATPNGEYVVNGEFSYALKEIIERAQLFSITDDAKNRSDSLKYSDKVVTKVK